MTKVLVELTSAEMTIITHLYGAKDVASTVRRVVGAVCLAANQKPAAIQKMLEVWDAKEKPIQVDLERGHSQQEATGTSVGGDDRDGVAGGEVLEEKVVQGPRS